MGRFIEPTDTIIYAMDGSKEAINSVLSKLCNFLSSNGGSYDHIIDYTDGSIFIGRTNERIGMQYVIGELPVIMDPDKRCARYRRMDEIVRDALGEDSIQWFERIAC